MQPQAKKHSPSRVSEAGKKTGADNVPKVEQTKTASEGSTGKKKKIAKNASQTGPQEANLPAFMYKDTSKKNLNRGLGAPRQGSIEDLALSQSRLSQRSHLSVAGAEGGKSRTNVVMWLAAGGAVITIVLALLAFLYLFKDKWKSTTTTGTPTGRAGFDPMESTSYWESRNGSLHR